MRGSSPRWTDQGAPRCEQIQGAFQCALGNHLVREERAGGSAPVLDAGCLRGVLLRLRRGHKPSTCLWTPLCLAWLCGSLFVVPGCAVRFMML